MGFKVAVVGATGNVGREILTTLAERNFPADDVIALASSRSIGSQVSFGEDDVLDIQGLDSFDFRGVDIVLSSPGELVSGRQLPARTASAPSLSIRLTATPLPHLAPRPTANDSKHRAPPRPRHRASRGHGRVTSGDVRSGR